MRPGPSLLGPSNTTKFSRLSLTTAVAGTCPGVVSFKYCKCDQREHIYLQNTSCSLPTTASIRVGCVQSKITTCKNVGVNTSRGERSGSLSLSYLRGSFLPLLMSVELALQHPLYYSLFTARVLSVCSIIVFFCNCSSGHLIPGDIHPRRCGRSGEQLDGRRDIAVSLTTYRGTNKALYGTLFGLSHGYRGEKYSCDFI